MITFHLPLFPVVETPSTFPSRRNPYSSPRCLKTSQFLSLKFSRFFYLNFAMNISSLTIDSNPISRNFSAANPRTQRSPFIRHRNVVVCSVKSVPSSPSLVAAPAGEGLNRIESLSQVSAVLGCQWGDEGKGKLVDILAKHFDIVARCQVYTLWVLGFGF